MLQEQGSCDFAYAFSDQARFRTNVFRCMSNIGIVMRLIPTRIFSFEQLGLPKEIGILGKAFMDVGSLWGLGGPAQYSNTVLTSNTMRVSTGVGIQWISPFGPIRIDYAIPLVQDPWDKLENIRFSFGTRF